MVVSTSHDHQPISDGAVGTEAVVWDDGDHLRGRILAGGERAEQTARVPSQDGSAVLACDLHQEVALPEVNDSIERLIHSETLHDGHVGDLVKGDDQRPFGGGRDLLCGRGGQLGSRRGLLIAVVERDLHEYADPENHEHSGDCYDDTVSKHVAPLRGNAVALGPLVR